MSKKILHILTILSFLNFGLTTQKTFAQEINFDELDLDNIEVNVKENKKSEPGIKEQLSLLSEILKGMTLKEKTIFISDLLKYQIKEHKKACIITASSITAVAAILLTYKYGLKKD